jgi:hypothetical protein
MMAPVASRSAGTPACVICHTPLPFRQAQTSKLCSRADCHWHYSLLQKQNKICRICSRPLSIQDGFRGVCAAPECRRAVVADQAREQHQQRMQQERILREQAARLREQVTDRFGVRESDTFQLAIIPAAVHRMTRLPARRRREFREYLVKLIDRALALPLTPAVDPDPAADSDSSLREARLQAASGSACACCQGSCCRGGAHVHAFLTLDTLRRYRALNPDQSSRQILAAYMRRVGGETCEGSCVYHRADGCGLPREMRADTCNDFYCNGLREFRACVPATGSVRGFFVATADDKIIRAALVDEEQMLLASAPPVDAD